MSRPFPWRRSGSAWWGESSCRPRLEPLEVRRPVSDALLGSLLIAPVAGVGLTARDVPSQADATQPPLWTEIDNDAPLSGMAGWPGTSSGPQASAAAHRAVAPVLTPTSARTSDLASPLETAEGPPAGRASLLPWESVKAVNLPAPVSTEGGMAQPGIRSPVPADGQTPTVLPSPARPGSMRFNPVRPSGNGSQSVPDPANPGGGGDGPLTVQAGESPYLYGIHDLPDNVGTLDNLLNRKGWVFLMKYISAGPAPHDPLIDQLVGDGYGVVVRLHWDTGDGQGTLPVPSLYPAFAANAKGTVQNNPAAKYWIVANEPNLCTEWPVGNGYVCNGRGTTPITMANYASAYLQTYARIHELDGAIPYLHVIPAPLAIWAGDIPGATDFECDFDQLMQMIPHDRIDALAFHPKSHAYSAAAITDTTLSQPVFGCGHNQAVHWQFPIYRDLMDNVPADLRDRKVFFTELNPEPGWTNTDLGYNVAAYDEINRWNHGQVAGWTGQKVTGMMVYRWLGGEAQWNLRDKPNFQNDLRNAVTRGYRWDFASWSPWAATDNGGVTDDAPALAAFNNQLVALATGDDRQVYASTSADGSSWTAWAPLGSPATNLAPALATFEGTLFAFAVGQDGYVYLSASADGMNWGPWSPATPQYLGPTQPVAVAEYGGRLFVFARGSNQHIYFTASADGATWTRWRDTPPYNGLTNYAPAVAVFGGRLYVLVVGVGGNIFYNAFDGTTWSGWTLTYDGVQADQGVAAAVYDGQLVVMRKNPGATTLAYATTADGHTWNAWQDPGNGGATTVSPALAAFGARLYALRQDAGDRGLYVSSYGD